jgi:hypothetical protein
LIGRLGFEQTLVGSLRTLDQLAIEQPLTLALRARRALRLPTLARRFEVVGEIDARGFADRRPVRGTLSSPGGQLGARVYELELEANDGRWLALRARREPRLRHPLWSLSRVAGTLEDSDGSVVARVELRLDYREGLGRLLRM